MKKRQSRSPIKNRIDNKDDSRLLRSSKSFKKGSCHSFNKDTNCISKSLSSKKTKKGKDLFEKKFKTENVLSKNETQRNCRKSLLKRFDDIHDKETDDEDIPLGELLGDKKGLNGLGSLSPKNSMKSPKTPKRRNLRPRSPKVISDGDDSEGISNFKNLSNIFENKRDDTYSDDINMDSGTVNESPKELNFQNPRLNNSKVMLLNISHSNKDFCGDATQSELTIKKAIGNDGVALGSIKSDSNKESFDHSTNVSEEKSKGSGSSSLSKDTNHLSSMEKLDLCENDVSNNSSSAYSTPSKIMTNCNKNIMTKNDSPIRKPFENIPLTPSCYNSPSTGILRKRKLHEETNFSPSPKMRRVAFSEIVSTLEIPNRHDNLNKNLKQETREQCIKHEGNLAKSDQQSANKENGAPIFPELADSSTPIEAILPRIITTPWVRGLKNLLSAKNIKTIGDLAAATEADLETLPIPQPRSSRIRDALQHWMDQINKNKKAAATYKEVSDNEALNPPSDCKAPTDEIIAKKEEHMLQDPARYAGTSPNKESPSINETSNSFIAANDTLDKITTEKNMDATSTNIQLNCANETSDSCLDTNIPDKIEQDSSANATLTPETSTGEVALKMLNDLAAILKNKDEHKFSKEQLKIMFSKLMVIQGTICEHVNNLL